MSHKENQHCQHLDFGLPASKAVKKINFHGLKHLICSLLSCQTKLIHSEAQTGCRHSARYPSRHPASAPTEVGVASESRIWVRQLNLGGQVMVRYPTSREVSKVSMCRTKKNGGQKQTVVQHFYPSPLSKQSPHI